MKKLSVLLVLVVLLLAAAPSAFAIVGPRTRTVIVTEETCYTDAPNVSHYAFVNMSALGVTDPALNAGTLLLTQMENGVVEYGYYTADYGYQILGWSWLVDDAPQYSALDGGLLSPAQLEAALTAFQDNLLTNCFVTEMEIEIVEFPF